MFCVGFGHIGRPIADGNYGSTGYTGELWDVSVAGAKKIAISS